MKFVNSIRCALAAAAFAGAALIGQSAQAATVTYHFEGIIDQVRDEAQFFPGRPVVSNNFALGDQISGSITFSTEFSFDSFPSDPDVGLYQVNGSMVMNHASGSYGADDITHGVRYQNPAPGHDEQFISMNYMSSTPNQLEGQDVTSSGFIGFISDPGTVLPDDSFDNLLDIVMADWDQAYINMDFTYGTFPWGDRLGSVYASFTSWTKEGAGAVPAPGILGLMLLGIAGLTVFGRRQIQRPANA